VSVAACVDSQRASGPCSGADGILVADSIRAEQVAAALEAESLPVTPGVSFAAKVAAQESTITPPTVVSAPKANPWKTRSSSSSQPADASSSVKANPWKSGMKAKATDLTAQLQQASGGTVTESLGKRVKRFLSDDAGTVGMEAAQGSALEQPAGDGAEAESADGESERHTTEAEPLTEHRVEMRMQQIQLGKASESYANYIAHVAVEDREAGNPLHPTTPNARANISKRRFTGLMRQWRQRLHAWDEGVPEQLSSKGRRKGRLPSTQ
jgi:hypothetical protein